MYVARALGESAGWVGPGANSSASNGRGPASDVLGIDRVRVPGATKTSHDGAGSRVLFQPMGRVSSTETT